MRAETVDGADGQATDMDVPDIAVAFGDRQTRRLFPPVSGEKAEFDLLGMGRKDGKVHPVAREACTHRPRSPCTDGMARHARRQRNNLRCHAVSLS